MKRFVGFARAFGNSHHKINFGYFFGTPIKL